MSTKYYEILTEILEEMKKSKNNDDRYWGLAFTYDVVTKYWEKEIGIREKDANRKQETIS